MLVIGTWQGSWPPLLANKAGAFTQVWDWPFLGSGGNSDRPLPALDVCAEEGEFHISNYDTICSVWKWEPVDFNSPAVPTSR